MPESRDTDSDESVPSLAATIAPATLRAISDRLAAQSTTQDYRPPGEPTWPSWPHGTANPLQPPRTDPVIPSADGRPPAELAHGVLGRPDLAATTPTPDMAVAEAPPADLPPPDPVGRAIERPATCAVSELRVNPSASIVPAVPGPIPMPGAPDAVRADLPASDRPPVPPSLVDGEGEVPSIAPSTSPGPVPPISVGGPEDFGLPRDEGRTVGESPVVRNRLAGTLAGPGFAPIGAGDDNIAVGNRDNLQFAGPGAVPGAGSGFGSMAGAEDEGVGGPMTDLARINELLQQVLDAIRKQNVGGDGSLPVGGPSVYADRL